MLKNNHFFKTSIGNLLYVFSSALSIFLIIPIFLSSWGAAKYGEWLTIFFFTNSISFIFQGKINVDSNYISSINFNTQKLIIYFKKTLLVQLKQLFIIYLIIFLLFFFENLFFKTFFNEINNYKLIISILMMSSIINLFQINYLSIYRAKQKSDIFFKLISLKQLWNFINIFLFLKIFKFDVLEISISILILELIFLLIINNYYFLLFSKEKVFFYNKINSNKNIDLNVKKIQMTMFVFSEMTFNNLLPVLLGIFFTTTYVSSFHIHLQLSKIPRLVTMTINEAFRNVMGPLKENQKEGKYIYNSVMILVAINFWSFVLFSILIFFTGEYIFNLLVANNLQYLKDYLFSIVLYFFLESLWRSISTYNLSKNEHSQISRNYFFSSMFTLFFVILFIKEINFMSFFILQQFYMLFCSISFLKTKFKKVKFFNFIFIEFFKILLNILDKKNGK